MNVQNHVGSVKNEEGENVSLELQEKTVPVLYQMYQHVLLNNVQFGHPGVHSAHVRKPVGQGKNHDPENVNTDSLQKIVSEMMPISPVVMKKHVQSGEHGPNLTPAQNLVMVVTNLELVTVILEILQTTV